MNKPLSRTFTAMLVAVLLLCSAVVAFTLFHQASMMEKISQVQANLEAVQGRLRKQQLEYAQAIEALPVVQAELEVMQPEAQAVYEQEQTLRQQRKDLRAENSALADELAALQAQADAASAEVLQTAEAIDRLQDALNVIESLYGLYE